MRSLVVLIFTGLFMLAAIKSSFVAALLYWWFAIFRPQDWIWWDVSSLRLPAIAALLFVVPAIFKGFLPKIDNKLSFFMVIWLALASLAYFTVGCAGIGPMAEAMWYMMKLILVVLITERIMSDEKRILYVIGIVALSIGFHAGKAGVVSILQGGLVNHGADNLTGLFSGSNAFAMGSGMLVFFLIFVYLQVKNEESFKLFPTYVLSIFRQKAISWILFITIVGTVFNVISLFSRGAALATACGFLVFALLHPRRIKIFSFAIPICLFAVLFVPIPEGYEERIASAFAGKENLDASAASRPHFWKVARAITADHPLGVGPGCYMDFYNYYDHSGGRWGYYRSVHSSHFQILTETGYLGLGVWIMMLFTAWIKQLRIRKIAIQGPEWLPNPKFFRDCATMLICAQIVFVTGGSFYEWAHNDIIWLMMGITIALERLVVRYKSNNTISKHNNRAIR